MHDSGQELVVELPPSPVAPALARRAVEQLAIDRAQIPTVSLLASELVTNAVIHSGGKRPIRLRAAVRGAKLRLCVTDSGSGFEPPSEPRPANERGGYGLFLLDQLACRWGVVDTTVWFEMPAAVTG